MRLIKQKSENGCVSASVAMLAGLSYIQGVRLVHPFRQVRDQLGASTEQIIAALKRAKLFPRIHKVCPLKELKHDAILIIEHPIYEGIAHAVVWSFKEQRVLDPYPTKNRYPSKHLPQKSYQKYLTEIIEVRKKE